MKLKRFLLNNSGGMAVMFSIAMVPLLIAAGVATDIAHKGSVATLLQSATDAAAIAGANAKNAWGSDAASKLKIKKIVADFVTANAGTEALTNITTIDSGTDKITGVFYVRLTGKVDTTFMSLAGYKTMEVAASSEVDLGGQALEVALVLDNTASMSSEGRLDALKSSAKSLVDTLIKGKPANGYLKIGIVPFADYVNVGLSNRNANWMDVPKDSSTVQNICNVTYPNAVASNCHDEKGTWNNDGVPTPYTYQVCDWNYGKAVTVCANQTYTNQWLARGPSLWILELARFQNLILESKTPAARKRLQS
jgi:Flp pilus assembly protein TadG